MTFDPTPDGAAKRTVNLESEDLAVYDSLVGEQFELDDTFIGSCFLMNIFTFDYFLSYKLVDEVEMDDAAVFDESM